MIIGTALYAGCGTAVGFSALFFDCLRLTVQRLTNLVGLSLDIGVPSESDATSTSSLTTGLVYGNVAS